MLRICTALAVCSIALSFAPPTNLARVTPRTQMQLAPLLVQLSVVPAGFSAVKTALGLPTMYALFSLNEYVTHRYYQHNEVGKLQAYKTLREADIIPRLDGGGHVEHHAETYDDMSLKTDDAKWMASPPAQRLNSEKWRGTAFTWQVTALMIAQCIPTVYPVFMGVLGWSFAATTGLFLPSMMLHGLIWNALHPEMHGCPEVPIEVGLPSNVLAGLRGTWLFNTLYENHQGHHVASGRANYNVCCPGTDQLVGSYMPPEVWKPKMREGKARAIEGALPAEQM